MPKITSKQISDKASANGVASLDSGTKLLASQQTVGASRILYVDKSIGNDSNDGSIFRPFATIQAGINAASLIADFQNQVIVEVTPPNSNGVFYTENLTFSQQGVILRSKIGVFIPFGTMVLGTVTINLTGVAGSGYAAGGNFVTIQGFTFQKSGSNVLTFSGTVFQRLYLMQCYLQCQTTGSALVMTNTGTNAGSKSTITSYDTWYETTSATLPVILQSAGSLYIAGANPTIQNGNAAGPSFKIDGASASGSYTQIGNATVTGQLIISDNTSNALFGTTIFTSGSLATISGPGSLGSGGVSVGYCSFTTTANYAITGFLNLGLTQGNAWGSTGNTIDPNVNQILYQSLPSSSNVTSSGVPNVSTVAGSFVTDALNTIEGHVTSIANPHAVTAAQAGAVAASGVAKITVGTSAPISPATGDLWVDTN